MTPPPDNPAPPRGLTFAARLSLAFCALVLLTGLSITLLAFRAARQATTDLSHALFREVSARAATQSSAFVSRAAPLVESLSQLAAGNGLAVDDPDRLAPQLVVLLRANPGITWISYADTAGTFTGAYRPPEGGIAVNRSRVVDGHTPQVEYDVPDRGPWRERRRDDESGYDPRTRPFYQQARAAGRLVWLPPYLFYRQQIPGISCARPVYDDAGKFLGVVSVDFDLNALSEFVSTLSISPHSQVFIFTRDRALLAHPALRPRADAPAPATPPAPAPRLLTLADVHDPRVDAFASDLLPEDLAPYSPTRTSRFRAFSFDQGGARHLASATRFTVGDDVWIIGAVAPESDLLGGVHRTRAVAFAAATAALLLALAAAVLLARRVSGPVSALIAFMGRVGKGDLDARADLGGGREFRDLAAALNRMIADLRDHLRMRHSLKVAMDVQKQLLPSAAPAVPGLDIAGHSTYCDETGGDYYDFLVLDRSQPHCVMAALGDVMGHGVASALVMAGARAVLRDRAPGQPLADLMARINRLLADDLGGTRFMTMHLSRIDTQARTFRWVSAGHDPALIFDPATDTFDEIDEAGVPLGIQADWPYEEFTYDNLRPGHVIAIGTDGIWEAPNPDGEMFGKDRLRQTLRDTLAQNPHASARQISDAILARLTAFRAGHHATDDVTFVVFRLTPTPAPTLAAPTHTAHEKVEA